MSSSNSHLHPFQVCHYRKVFDAFAVRNGEIDEGGLLQLMDMFGPTIDRAEARRLLHQYAKSSKRRRLLFDEFLSLLCDYLRLAARCDHLVDRAFHHLEERQLQHKGGSAPQHQGLSASDVYQILCAEGPFQLSVEEAHEILDEFFPDEWRTTKQKIQPGMFADKIAFNLLHWVRAPDLFPGDENTYDDNNGNSRTNHANVAYMSSSQQPSHQYSGHSIKAGRSSSSSPPSSSVLSRTPRLTDPHKLPSNPSGEIIIRIMGMSNLHHFCRSKVRKDEGLAFYTIDPMLTVECDGITVRSTILLNQKTPKWNQELVLVYECPSRNLDDVQAWAESTMIRFNLYDYQLLGVVPHIEWVAGGSLPLSCALRSTLNPMLYNISLHPSYSTVPIHMEVSLHCVRTEEEALVELFQWPEEGWLHAAALRDKLRRDFARVTAEKRDDGRASEGHTGKAGPGEGDASHNDVGGSDRRKGQKKENMKARAKLKPRLKPSLDHSSGASSKISSSSSSSTSNSTHRRSPTGTDDHDNDRASANHNGDESNGGGNHNGRITMNRKQAGASSIDAPVATTLSAFWGSLMSGGATTNTANDNNYQIDSNGGSDSRRTNGGSKGKGQDLGIGIGTACGNGDVNMTSNANDDRRRNSNSDVNNAFDTESKHKSRFNTGEKGYNNNDTNSDNYGTDVFGTGVDNGDDDGSAAVYLPALDQLLPGLFSSSSPSPSPSSSSLPNSSSISSSSSSSFLQQTPKVELNPLLSSQQPAPASASLRPTLRKTTSTTTATATATATTATTCCPSIPLEKLVSTFYTHTRNQYKRRHFRLVAVDEYNVFRCMPSFLTPIPVPTPTPLSSSSSSSSSLFSATAGGTATLSPLASPFPLPFPHQHQHQHQHMPTISSKWEPPSTQPKHYRGASSRPQSPILTHADADAHAHAHTHPNAQHYHPSHTHTHMHTHTQQREPSRDLIDLHHHLHETSLSFTSCQALARQIARIPAHTSADFPLSLTGHHSLQQLTAAYDPGRAMDDLFDLETSPSTHPGLQIASPPTVLSRGTGTEVEKALFLCGLFLGLGLDAYVCTGHDYVSTRCWVVVVEHFHDDDLDCVSDSDSEEEAAEKDTPCTNGHASAHAPTNDTANARGRAETAKEGVGGKTNTDSNANTNTNAHTHTHTKSEGQDGVAKAVSDAASVTTTQTEDPVGLISSKAMETENGQSEGTGDKKKENQDTRGRDEKGAGGEEAGASESAKALDNVNSNDDGNRRRTSNQQIESPHTGKPTEKQQKNGDGKANTEHKKYKSREREKEKNKGKRGWAPRLTRATHWDVTTGLAYRFKPSPHTHRGPDGKTETRRLRANGKKGTGSKETKTKRKERKRRAKKRKARDAKLLRFDRLGISRTTKVPMHIFLRVGGVFNHKNVWVNTQARDEMHDVQYDLRHSPSWSSFLPEITPICSPLPCSSSAACASMSATSHAETTRATLNAASARTDDGDTKNDSEVAKIDAGRSSGAEPVYPYRFAACFNASFLQTFNSIHHRILPSLPSPHYLEKQLTKHLAKLLQTYRRNEMFIIKTQLHRPMSLALGRLLDELCLEGQLLSCDGRGQLWGSVQWKKALWEEREELLMRRRRAEMARELTRRRDTTPGNDSGDGGKRSHRSDTAGGGSNSSDATEESDGGDHNDGDDNNDDDNNDDDNDDDDGDNDDEDEDDDQGKEKEWKEEAEEEENHSTIYSMYVDPKSYLFHPEVLPALPENHVWYGKPFHFSTLSALDIFLQLKYSGLLNCSVPNASYAIACRVVSYPWGLQSVWVFVGYVYNVLDVLQ